MSLCDKGFFPLSFLEDLKFENTKRILMEKLPFLPEDIAYYIAAIWLLGERERKRVLAMQTRRYKRACRRWERWQEARMELMYLHNGDVDAYRAALSPFSRKHVEILAPCPALPAATQYGEGTDSDEVESQPSSPEYSNSD